MTLKFSSQHGSELVWTKSTYSGSDDNDCVEAAVSPGTVHVRDSKNVPGPQLAFPARAWAEFVSYALPR
jgi:hypothetical protein